MENTPYWWLFWSSFWTILYTLLGFPLLVYLRGVLRIRPIRHAPCAPKVSLIIAAYNEAIIIRQKLDNTFALDYPPDCLEVFVASDGSDDGTDELVSQYGRHEVILLSLPRQGKNLTLNAAAAMASGDILIFTDADTMLAPDALRFLVAPFNDPEVGGVAGDYRHNTNVAEGASERDYWRIERTLKRLQSRAGSVTSAWGPIYAIRRSLFKSIPMGVTDDYFTSVQPLTAHQRLIFEPRAIATGPVAASAQAEFQRKVRIITAGLRGVWQTRHLLNPFEYGFLAIQLFSHKVLRRLMGIPLVFLAVSAPILWQHGWFYKLITISQFCLHGAAVLGFLLRGTSLGLLKVLRLPFFLDMTYTAATVALFNLLGGTRHDIWTPRQHKSSQ